MILTLTSLQPHPLKLDVRQTVNVPLHKYAKTGVASTRAALITLAASWAFAPPAITEQAVPVLPVSLETPTLSALNVGSC